MDDKEKEERDPFYEGIDKARKRQTREQLPGLLISITMMVLGVLAMIVLILMSKPPPG